MVELVRVEALRILAENRGSRVAAQFAGHYLDRLDDRLALLARSAAQGEADQAHTIALALVVSSEMLGCDALAESLRQLLGPIQEGALSVVIEAMPQLAEVTAASATALAGLISTTTPE